MSSIGLIASVILVLNLFSGAFGKTANKFVIEDGPFGGNGGSAWTDGTGINMNGPITAIEIHSGSEVDGIKTRLIWL